jgi:hypothetical protein
MEDFIEGKSYSNTWLLPPATYKLNWWQNDSTGTVSEKTIQPKRGSIRPGWGVFTRRSRRLPPISIISTFCLKQQRLRITRMECVNKLHLRERIVCIVYHSPAIYIQNAGLGCLGYSRASLCVHWKTKWRIGVRFHRCLQFETGKLSCMCQTGGKTLKFCEWKLQHRNYGSKSSKRVISTDESCVMSTSVFCSFNVFKETRFRAISGRRTTLEKKTKNEEISETTAS